MTEHKIIAICSYKGGVGVSTFTANLTSALVRLGRRCLVIDLSPTCRSADHYLGLTEQVIYDLGDVCSARVNLGDAVLAASLLYGFYLLPGVFSDRLPDSETLEMITRRAFEELMVDTVVFDVRGSEMHLLSPFITDVLVLTDESSLSVNAAARASVALGGLGIDDARLVINRFGMGASKISVIDTIDAACIPLIALIPASEDMRSCADEGRLVFDAHPDSACAVAYMNTAHRLLGENIPLLSGIRGINRRRILKV